MTTIACERLAMGDVAPALIERREGTQDASDPRFRQLLGEIAWQQLPEPIRNRFAKVIPPGGCIAYRGEVVATEIPPAGRLLVGLARLIGSPLPLDDGATGPSVVTVTEHPDSGGQTWERTYTRNPRRRWERLSAVDRREPRAPQVVRSTKCFAGPTGLEEQVAGGLGMALRVSVEAGRLVFRSQHYFLRLGRRRLILPALVCPGRMEIVHEQLPDGRFSFGLTLTHPHWGILLHQLAYFSDPVSSHGLAQSASLRSTPRPT
ncbi:MAG: DUF4166 domain-containing protein [Hyphomicrobium sp.]